MLYLRQAIETKYYGPTNRRGARIKATAQAGSVTISWDHALGVEENHARAAEAFANKYEWEGVWVGGANTNGDGYTFVNSGMTEPAFIVKDGSNA